MINPAFNVYRIFDMVSASVLPRRPTLAHILVVSHPVGCLGFPVWIVYFFLKVHLPIGHYYFFLPSGSFFEAQSPIYFDREDVKKAIHAPLGQTWVECSDIDVFPNGDASLPPAFTVLPDVIEKSNRSVIIHGLGDFILIAEGARVVLQKSVQPVITKSTNSVG